MMAYSNSALPVSGTVSADAEDTMLVLSTRLDGHDTFLTGQLEFDQQQAVSVRILTFDDVTVLRVLDGSIPAQTTEWSGTLHLPHGWRTRKIPDDLAAAAEVAQRDLASLDEAELRYALTFLEEAATVAIRQGRTAAIVNALPILGGIAT
jgi:hypothetical protein